MLIAVERLLVRVRQVPSRADELIALRRRVRAERSANPGVEERATAAEILALKEKLSHALASVTACATCAVGKRWPRGAFPGGDCCSAVTADLFSDDEVAALVQSGTRPRHLDAPRTDHAGCAFRGETGCTLSAAHRPGRCVHYTCFVLRTELRARGELGHIDELRTQLQEAQARFHALREARLDDELLVPLETALRDQGRSQR
ncbi:MAG: hypothetical protein SFX73_22315 [Kofleriaceae bacterium]|nr:hypothetical protein [Kofleriaceae bacterium]